MTATRRALLTVAPVAALTTSNAAPTGASAVMVSTWDFGAAANAASHRVIGRWTRIERAGALFA